MQDHPGKLWDAVRRWASTSDTEREAQRLRADSSGAGCTPLSAAPQRQPVRLRGTLQTVTLRPRAGMPALEAELYDGSGVLTLIWLGRRRIGGIDCGRSLTVTGRITSGEGRRVMYNPRYELMPAGDA